MVVSGVSLAKLLMAYSAKKAMTTLKKPLVIAIAVAVLVSPFLPSAFADSGEWSDTMAEAAWDYDFYQVQRLELEGVDGPYQFADVLFVTEGSDKCEFEESCNLVDVTILSDGQEFLIEGVADTIESDFWHTAQDDRFIFRVPSEDDIDWGTVYEFDTASGSLSELMVIERNDADLAFMTFATDGDRVYTSILTAEDETGEVEAQLSVFDLESGYERDDFSYTLTAPWQEIEDVQDGISLVKFQFSGGFEQLWLIDQTARSMEAIPGTWTEEPGDIVGAHFTSDGVVHYFQNYHLYSFEPGVDEVPVDAGGAFLSWFADSAEDVVQIVGDVMAYIDDENGLYVRDLTGVSKFGVALDGDFTLESDAIHFQNDQGEYVSYTFETGEWMTRAYQVTDAHDDILVGIDANGNVWYENVTTEYLMNVGFGSDPLLTDREHAYWVGEDSATYEVTFLPLLDLERADVEAFTTVSSSDVYLVSGSQMWLVPDENVYFSWFTSWDDTLVVSEATLDVYHSLYAFEGDLKFAPGTRVKAATSPRVYVVGSDYKLHWITSETIADEIFGNDWNVGIIEVNATSLWSYGSGANVTSGEDVKTI
jgi:hypothetical protein